MRTLLPRLAIDLSEPLDPQTLFAHPHRETWLEIGFGGGEHLLATAARHEDVGFIGCEPFLNGMARALADLATANLENIRLHNGDAGEIIDRLPSASISRIFLLYPDPWPKRRQRKRRFVSDDMLTRLARVMRPGGEFRFATDWPDYAAWSLQRVLQSPMFAWTAKRADDWRTPWPGFTRTRYEAKAIREGRTPCYLVFRRN